MSANCVLITGSGAGLGKSFAFECASKGFDVVLVSKFQHELDTTRAELAEKFPSVTVYSLCADLSLPDADELIIAFVAGNNLKLKGLINNVGMGYTNHYTSNPKSFYNLLMQLNVTLPYRLTYECLKNNLLDRGSFILNISSMAALFPLPYKALYAASKAFVLNFSRALFVELRPQGIHVACVCPGPMPTNKEVQERIQNIGWRSRIAGVIPPDKVAAITLNATLKKKHLIFAGFTDKLNYIFSRILPYKMQPYIFGMLSNKPG